MKNIITGWVSSLFGLAIMIGVALHFFGAYEFPNPSMLNTLQESGIAFLVGAIFFFVPATKLEAILTKKAEEKSDKL